MKSDWLTAALADTPGGVWLLDETSGRPADSSGNGNNVSAVTGTPTYLGGEGGMVFVAASTQYLTVPDANSLDMADNWAIEAWVLNPSAVAASKGIFSKGGTASYMRLQTRLPATLRENTNLLMVGAASVPADSSWHQVVGIKNGAVEHVYLDGALSDGAVTSTAATLSTALVATIGSNVGHTEGFDGGLRWIGYYPAALSAAQVLAHYQAGIASAPGATLQQLAPLAHRFA